VETLFLETIVVTDMLLAYSYLLTQQCLIFILGLKFHVDGNGRYFSALHSLDYHYHGSLYDL